MVKFLQRIGKSLMLPIACLPIAGLMLRLGQGDVVSFLSFIPGIDVILPLIGAAGSALFDNLPLLFAIGVAIGLSDDQNGASGLAGAISYLILTNMCAAYWAKYVDPDLAATLNISFLGGILAGVIAGLSYNKFRKTRLPEYLAFFGGRRFVPIMTGLISFIVAIPLAFIWPTLQSLLGSASAGIAGLGAFGVALFMFFNRLLIPLGLHHVLNSFFWFQLGDFNGVTGDLNRFFAGDPTAGHFMAGFFPMMMFGLPALGLAIYFAAKKEKRKAVGGMLVSLALTSFLTGVTEPLEFLFIFLSPVLLILHALLTAISGAITDLLGVLHGFTFSAGFIDYALNFTLATRPLLIILIGLIMAVLYFVVFYFAITKLDLPTPGRTDDDIEQDIQSGIQDGLKPIGATDDAKLASEYIEALGGAANIVSIDNCATRLRIEVRDSNLVNEAALKAIGAKGVVRLNPTNIQIIVGTKVEFVADAIKAFLK